MPLNRLKRKTTTENLWLYILTLLKKEHLYAYEIRKKIEQSFGFKIGTVTAYRVLYKLNKSGYVTSKWSLKSGRQRRYYIITKKGRELLKEGADYLKELLDKLNV